MEVVYVAPMTHFMFSPTCHYHLILVVEEVVAVDICYEPEYNYQLMLLITMAH